MAEISRRRTDKFGDLMRMLKLGTVDLDDCVRFIKQDFGCSLDDSRFTRAGRPEEKHRADRPRRIVHPGQIYLKQSAHSPNGTFLADDPARQFVFELSRPGAFAFGVKQNAFFRCLLFLGRFLFHLSISVVAYGTAYPRTFILRSTCR